MSVTTKENQATILSFRLMHLFHFSSALDVSTLHTKILYLVTYLHKLFLTGFNEFAA